MLLDENNNEKWFDLEGKGKHGLKATIATVNDKDRVFVIVRSSELLDQEGIEEWPFPTFISDKTHVKDRKKVIG